MSQTIVLEHLLIEGDTLLQALQDHAYGKIAAIWTRNNPDCPVLYSSAMILAMVRGLHHAWSQGSLTGEQVAQRLAEFTNRDWAALIGTKMTAEGCMMDPARGKRQPRPLGFAPGEQN